MSANKFYSFKNTANWLQNMPFVAVKSNANHVAIPVNGVNSPNHIAIQMNRSASENNMVTPKNTRYNNNNRFNNLRAENVANLQKVNINSPNWDIQVGNRGEESIPAALLPATKTRRRRSNRKHRRTARR